MLTLTPILINPSLTSKWAHVCSPTVIATSLVVPKTPQAFPLVALLGLLSVREKENELESPFHCLRARHISLT